MEHRFVPQGNRMALGAMGILFHALALTSTVWAQNTIKLPQRLTVSPGGVDLQSGTYHYRHEDIASGDLVLERDWHGYSGTSEIDGWLRTQFGFAHNLLAGVTVQRVDRPEGGTFAQRDWLVAVHIGDRTQMFRRSYSLGATYTQNGGGKGTSLSYSGGNNIFGQVFTFTDADDTIYQFASTQLASGCTGTNCAAIESITKPSGERLDFSYANGVLAMVKNNRGHALGFEQSGGLIVKVCAINLAYQTFTPGSACPSGAPNASYSYTAGSMTYVSPAGGSYAFSREAEDTTSKSITLPAGSGPWMTLSSCSIGACGYMFRQDFADGTWYNYTINSVASNGVYTGNFVSPAGTTSWQLQEGSSWDVNSAAYFSVPAGGPSLVTDPLNRSSSADYCVWTSSWYGNVCSVQQVPSTVTSPEGDQTIFTYDYADNPTQAVYKAKTGSGLPDRTMSATYAYTTGAKGKPLTVTDARGQVTTYTYDAVHGGVLTETSPADAGGVQAVKRYAYSQHYAWLSTGSGYAPAASPVWLLDTMKTCRTSATSGGGCAGGTGDEVVTSYDYGPNAGPNNLLLRGVAVTADGQTRRTCYGYDAQGNRIWETKPRAGLASCY